METKKYYRELSYLQTLLVSAIEVKKNALNGVFNESFVNRFGFDALMEDIETSIEVCNYNINRFTNCYSSQLY